MRRVPASAFATFAFATLFAQSTIAAPCDRACLTGFVDSYFKALLAQTDDPAARRAMLAAKVEDMLNTVVRQVAFYTFERQVHLERREGELTAERLGQIWLDVQAESLGPAIELKPGYETFWSYISHFVHAPF